MIKPTIGRVLHFYPQPPTEKDPQPRAALVTHVWNDHLVNLAVFTKDGEIAPEQTTSVALIQEGEPLPTSGRYAVWPVRACG